MQRTGSRQRRPLTLSKIRVRELRRVAPSTKSST
jgi:hypothetical protein